MKIEILEQETLSKWFAIPFSLKGFSVLSSSFLKTQALNLHTKYISSNFILFYFIYSIFFSLKIQIILFYSIFVKGFSVLC